MLRSFISELPYESFCEVFQSRELLIWQTGYFKLRIIELNWECAEKNTSAIIKVIFMKTGTC